MGLPHEAPAQVARLYAMVHGGRMAGRPDALASSVHDAHDIDAPSDPIVSRIFRYWDSKRGPRRMPSRADIDPIELRRHVNNVILYDVIEVGRLYRIRLVGSAIVEFYGVNATGEWAGSHMPPEAAAQMIEILTGVVIGKAPCFRAGRAHWHKDKSYRTFEACFLPLSPDDEQVDKIFGAIAFDITT